MNYLRISWEKGLCGGGGVTPPHPPPPSTAVFCGQIFKDDVNGFLPPQIFASRMVSYQERALNRGYYLMYVEDQAFSLSYDLAVSPSPPPLPLASCLSFSVFLCVAGWAYIRERWGGEGEEANSYDDESLVLYKPLTTLWPWAWKRENKNDYAFWLS
jgi:hypothetical protein